MAIMANSYILFFTDFCEGSTIEENEKIVASSFLGKYRYKTISYGFNTFLKIKLEPSISFKTAVALALNFLARADRIATYCYIKREDGDGKSLITIDVSQYVNIKFNKAFVENPKHYHWLFIDNKTQTIKKETIKETLKWYREEIKEVEEKIIKIEKEQEGTKKQDLCLANLNTKKGAFYYIEFSNIRLNEVKKEITDAEINKILENDYSLLRNSNDFTIKEIVRKQDKIEKIIVGFESEKNLYCIVNNTLCFAAYNSCFFQATALISIAKQYKNEFYDNSYKKFYFENIIKLEKNDGYFYEDTFMEFHSPLSNKNVDMSFNSKREEKFKGYIKDIENTLLTFANNYFYNDCRKEGLKMQEVKKEVKKTVKREVKKDYKKEVFIDFIIDNIESKKDRDSAYSYCYEKILQICNADIILTSLWSDDDEEKTAWRFSVKTMKSLFYVLSKLFDFIKSLYYCRGQLKKANISLLDNTDGSSKLYKNFISYDSKRVGGSYYINITNNKEISIKNIGWFSNHKDFEMEKIIDEIKEKKGEDIAFENCNFNTDDALKCLYPSKTEATATAEAIELKEDSNTAEATADDLQEVETKATAEEEEKMEITKGKNKKVGFIYSDIRTLKTYLKGRTFNNKWKDRKDFLENLFPKYNINKSEIQFETIDSFGRILYKFFRFNWFLTHSIKTCFYILIGTDCYIGELNSCFDNNFSIDFKKYKEVTEVDIKTSEKEICRSYGDRIIRKYYIEKEPEYINPFSKRELDRIINDKLEIENINENLEEFANMYNKEDEATHKYETDFVLFKEIEKFNKEKKASEGKQEEVKTEAPSEDLQDSKTESEKQEATEDKEERLYNEVIEFLENEIKETNSYTAVQKIKKEIKYIKERREQSRANKKIYILEYKEGKMQDKKEEQQQQKLIEYKLNKNIKLLQDNRKREELKSKVEDNKAFIDKMTKERTEAQNRRQQAEAEAKLWNKIKDFLNKKEIESGVDLKDIKEHFNSYFKETQSKTANEDFIIERTNNLIEKGEKLLKESIKEYEKTL